MRNICRQSIRHRTVGSLLHEEQEPGLAKGKGMLLKVSLLLSFADHTECDIQPLRSQLPLQSPIGSGHAKTRVPIWPSNWLIQRLREGMQLGCKVCQQTWQVLADVSISQESQQQQRLPHDGRQGWNNVDVAVASVPQVHGVLKCSSRL